MADTEVRILIRAIDDATKTLEKISSSITKTEKNVEKQTKLTTSSFQRQTDSLIAVGNVAGSVDSIMSSYQNLQLRLENSTERVANAQDRLREAQNKLNKTMNNSKSTTEDIAEARQNVISATRSLTVSENNLTRTQNQVIGTYINMTVQSLSLAKSLPVVITSIRATTVAMDGLKVATLAAAGPFAIIGIAIVAIGAIILNHIKEQKELKKAEEDLITTKAELVTAVERQAQVIAKLNDKIGILRDTSKEAKSAMLDMVSKKSVEEAISEKNIADLKHRLLTEELTDDERVRFEKAIALEEEKQTKFESAREIALAEIELRDATNQKITGDAMLANQMVGKNANEINRLVASNYQTEMSKAYTTVHEGRMEELRIANAEIDRLNIEVTKLEGRINEIKGKQKELGKGELTAPITSRLTGTGPGARTPAFGASRAKRGGDFILRPTGEMIETDPKDTIFAMRDTNGLSGITINIESLIANDAQSVAETLQQVLKEKINI